MLEVVLLSTVIVFLMVVTGSPVALLFFAKKNTEKPLEFSIFLAIAITSGFGLSAFSASLAYSFFGINNYFQILTFIGFGLWISVIIARKKIVFRLSNIKGYTYFLLISFLISIYFAKSQWDANLKPRIFSGVGPDVSQNLLAAYIAPSLGSTWFESSNQLIKSLGANNLYDAAVKMFEIPSFVQIAGYDYLVFGIRWGLTVPFSQIIEIFGPQNLMLEIGTVLLVTLLSTLIISFSLFRIASKTCFFSALGAVTLSLNGSFLNQYFNGGLSQGLGLIGNFGIFVIFIILLTDNTFLDTKREKIGLFVISTLAWMSSAISYVDATFVIGIFIIFLTITLLVSQRNKAKKLLIFLILPGVTTLILNPVFTYTIWENLNFRINANLGTGVNTGVWRVPTQNLGFASSYSQFSENDSTFVRILSVFVLTIFVGIIFYVFKMRPKSTSIFFTSLIISCALVLLGFALAITSRNSSDYIYNKITTFLAPIILISFLLFINSKSTPSLKSVNAYTNIFAACFIFISALFVEHSYASGRDYATIIPHQYANLLENEQINGYFQESNYILPYKPAYNFVGLFGVHYWVSKAPNDMNYAIDSRLDKPLKLLCFVGENICQPKGARIYNEKSSELEKFGILEFESALNTRDYFNLTITDRYNYAFDEMGTQRSVIPEKYMGGNPYLK
jgi:hypothetical protein